MAARVLCQVATGRSLSEALPRVLEEAPPRDRALIQELSYGVSRWRIRLQALLGRLLERPLKPRDRDLEALILVGLYQLLYLRMPSHAAVAATVEAARSLDKPWAVGLINGVLRHIQREREALEAAVDADPVTRFSHPAWLQTALRKVWPKRWEAIMEAGNRRPPMSLRVNMKLGSRQAYLGRLLEAGIPSRPIKEVSSGLLLDAPVDALVLPGFSEGWVSVQDGGAQLAVGLLDLHPDQQVLDVCAAPGGKSCHILEAAPEGVVLTAVDLDEQRMERVRENLQRLGLSARLFIGDAVRPRGEWAETACYDRILLDAPCSATGVIRRHPDIKQLRRAEDIVALAETQGRMLSAIWPLLKPGGMLLYVTCSLMPEENEQQVEGFLALQEDARERLIDAAWGHVRRVGRQTLPGEDSMDGFYFACIEKV